MNNNDDIVLIRAKLYERIKARYRILKDNDSSLRQSKTLKVIITSLNSSVSQSSNKSKPSNSLIGIKRNLQIYRLLEELDTSADWLFERTDIITYQNVRTIQTSEDWDTIFPILLQRLRESLLYIAQLDVEIVNDTEGKFEEFLAERFTVSSFTVQGWMKMDRRNYIGLHHVHQIAEQADVSIDWMLGLVDDPMAHKRHLLPDDYPTSLL
ncbi:hypothetical protein EXIGUO8H_360011 [Exiguobacterium sp. 8H]|uniref:hypothetical protein n=1 Tax=unclassified Exiguobacterium TaxID=2644629 RepID=UPI0012F0322C|nr:MULTISPECIES: hypothetical protein [unclassified Exiguobacterium]VXB83411.1 hypothetical protein EXIGUO8H_360011 [Exiguobacterium sp. 8H]VXC25139.1 hypothetical protein EXIGUO8A_830003 [Exiguobacterium sp. 8A]